MSPTETGTPAAAVPAAKGATFPLLTLRDLTEVLVRYYGIKEGTFELLMEYQFGLGAFGPDAESRLPGVAVSLVKIGLQPSQLEGPMTVNAAGLASTNVVKA